MSDIDNLHQQLKRISLACGSVMIHTIQDRPGIVCVHPGNDPQLEFQGAHLPEILAWVEDTVALSQKTGMTLTRCRSQTLLTRFHEWFNDAS